MKRLPLLAIVTALASLLPLFGCTCAILFLSPDHTPRLLTAAVGYGAVMLSFLGAVHWGMALEQPDIIPAGGTQRLTNLRLVLGGLPAFIGWIGLCAATVQELAGLMTLIAGFAATIVVERVAWRQGAMPRGYMTVQWFVICLAELCFVAILAACMGMRPGG
ncbi:DUF3429 domain-containing protein [Komagataeibacter nataicola]|uniref:DUF3429 domain-containing protein n=1 Tax=Komagataeibacter nataicola TaxID=265960 RepID=A0A9N7C4I6_9PROT|nr:DUF3429 domain-containing protein [Komagataeibacter nataicola]AQU86518.1 DUF3429 domain-containing protein [Komagataeibacter nataicola]PYD66370.1 DUF3429 domain-containing protein [Komagataeibacter nataicola]WEQ56590.1 DUF3429 domain-containing protein [Komagataeibacter nataicola]WNM08079.1 DUF3429 domain-containing protein [Komagataeibacter nataicola]GBR13288.1 hypothetical protein AA0616_0036 [Komagataeibacter nataicola NRIC 0616]